MTKIDIFSGFLGAGKTTLIKKLIQEAYGSEKIVLIENEFGEIGIDSGFLKDSGVEITEMNSGCICCSLVGDFSEALKKVLGQFHPDRILIEPSGVGKLSDVIAAVQNIQSDEMKLNGLITVADAGKCKLYMKNFGEFFNDQVAYASTIVLSRTADIKEEKLVDCVALLRTQNPKAPILTTAWTELTGTQILDTIEQKGLLTEELKHLQAQAHHDHKHHEHDAHGTCDHDHDEHDAHCTCDHDHDEHDAHCTCDHDHDEHDAHCTCGHDHDEHDAHCGCGHHHDHDADEVFSSWGVETPRKYTEDELQQALAGLEDADRCGMVLRAKGIVPSATGAWLHFDYVPGESNVRTGTAEITGRLCVIGAKLKENELETLFLLK